MDYTTNPIRRLEEILNILVKNAGSTRTLLSICYEIDPNNTPAMYHALADLIKLADECKAIMEQIADNDIYIEPVVKAHKAISNIQLKELGYDSSSLVDKQTMYGLKFSVDCYKNKCGETVINKDQIASLQKDVEELINKLVESNLPSDLKQILCEKLEGIRKAFVSMRISGIEGLKSELESTAGALFLNKDEIIRNNKDENIQGVIGFLDKLNKFVSFGNGVKELVSFAKSLISPDK